MLSKLGMRRFYAYTLVLAYTALGFAAFYQPAFLWLLLLVLPFTGLYLVNIRQRRHTLLRNYPLLGYVRYLLESIRPELRQYFFESDLDGKPFNRRQRSIVYQRAKGESQTVPFGMQDDSQRVGYEWLAHSMYPKKVAIENLRVRIGSKQCSQPYEASIFNISAMSYGSLSKTAILALSGGAKLGGFAHNTGEGGVSPYHLEGGGDLIWQIGTGYFGCRTKEGNFCDTAFREQVVHPSIKMVEIKLSQGAKPGHGGILPAEKNTPEIAAIRRVEPYTTIYSPPGHSAFSDHFELLIFVSKLRKLSDGKPVGIKLCLGNKEDFESLCREMQRNDLYPDFITIDGAEGGTGAAPLEFTDNLGTPLYDALAFAHQCLQRFELRKEIKLLASGKIITGADILKAVALGADACYSARGMMFALGCIQALQCHAGTCPVGIATQTQHLYEGLDVTDKRSRVANFHRNTMKATMELMEACGYAALTEVDPGRVFRRGANGHPQSFQQIYFSQHIKPGVASPWKPVLTAYE